MLADNINYLKKKDPMLYKLLKKSEENKQEPQVILEEAKNNQKTLKIKKDNKTVYLHSKYDPDKEAELIIDKLAEREEITESTHVIFYGLGLGYHLDVFFRRFPQIEFSIYEPSFDVLIHYLNQKSLKNLPLKQLITIQCEGDNNGMCALFNALINGGKKQSIICDLPSYQKIFAEEYTAFLNQFREVVKSMRSSMHTNYAFKKRWILNSVINFKEVLTTPNILMENNAVFKGQTAIMVAAGPSLDYEIENLKLIKENRSAYIFSVGSAINTLLHHHVLPDVVCTYDPTKENQLVFKTMNELNETSIPMIFGSSVGFETLEEYKGLKYHTITSQDAISHYFLKVKNDQELITVSDAPTIAAVTLELIYKLGFYKVILVGQNLAYLNNKYYANGIDHQKTIEAEKEKGNYFQEIPDIDKIHGTEMLIDVDGNEVNTNDGFINMKKTLEFYIKNYDLLVVNATKGGAQIEGAEFIPLEELIHYSLKPGSFEGNEFSNIRWSELYDKEYIQEQLLKITKAFEVYQGLLALMKQQLIKIDELVMNKNTKQATLMYQKFDQSILELESNDFAKIFALPMNRVEHELLARNVQRIKKEKNELKKVASLIAYVNAFVNLLYGDSLLNKQLIDILTERISVAFTENKEDQ
jgi:hypothetical protein